MVQTSESLAPRDGPPEGDFSQGIDHILALLQQEITESGMGTLDNPLAAGYVNFEHYPEVDHPLLGDAPDIDFTRAAPLNPEIIFGLDQDFDFIGPDLVLPRFPTPAVLAATSGVADIPATPPPTLHGLNGPPAVPVPTLPIIDAYTIPYQDIHRLPSDISIAVRREMLQSALMRIVLPNMDPINQSQVWRVSRREDGTTVLVRPIRPAGGRINGLNTDLAMLNMNLTLPCCPTNGLSARVRHQRETMKHFARLRPYCLEGLMDVSHRLHSNQETDGTYRGLHPNSKRKAASQRQDLAGIDAASVRGQDVVTDAIVATLMNGWDVLPDTIAAELGPDYFVFPECFVQIRDVLCAQENENSWTPPPPSEVLTAVEDAMALHDYFNSFMVPQIA